MLLIAKHRVVIFNILQQIYKSKLKSALGFKGGTMAYLFYGLDRFSVDLDFDLLKPLTFEDLNRTLLPILKKHGTITDQKDKRYTYFYLLSYQKGAQALKVEVNKKISPSNEYHLQNFYGISVLIQNEDIALASKILACLERKRLASRDFFDVNYYLSKGVLPNEEYIKNKAKITVKEALVELINRTEKTLNDKNILMGLGELIDNKKKVWVKTKLKKELVARLEFMTNQIGN